MEANRFDFEVFPPSVLQMLRTARSHLRRHSGSEDANSSRPNTGSEAAARRRPDVGLVRGGRRLSRPSLGPPVSSENVAPEKFQAPRSLGEFQEARETEITLGMKGEENEDMAPSANARWLAPTAPRAVLGNATNTYTLGRAPAPPKAPDFALAVQPEALPQLPPPAPGSLASLFSEGLSDVTPQQPENAQEVKEYEQDIFQLLKNEELKYAPSPNYMDRQVHVNSKMRAILVDWLVDVNKKYKLRAETLFLAVQLIDRYLDVQVTAKSHLQLVGATCLLIAAKFEEVYPPQIKEFEYITDKAYSRDEILKMEGNILKSLQFKLCCPTAMAFLDKYQSVSGCTDAHRALAQYLLELTLVDYKMLKYTPSHLTAAAVLLSNKLLRQPSWTPEAVKQTRMTEQMLKECAKEMCGLLELAETSSLQAIRRKFSAPVYHSVAKLNFTDRGPSSSISSTSSARAPRKSTTNGAI